VKYVIDLGGERREVSLEAGGVLIDGERQSAHLADVDGTPIHLVTIGQELHQVIVAPGESRGQYTLWIDGFRFQVEALDERTRAIRDMTAASARDTGPRPLIAPMPGLVVRVNVREGDQVQQGQGLVVMEAMKMENELRATSSGVVKTVHARPGTAVDKGAVLIELAR
jgi:acetyl/propionyl-CoA carboxylase alpha subunit